MHTGSPARRPLPFAPLVAAVVAGWPLSGGDAATFICNLALAGIVIAATERRHVAMLTLAGMAAGIAIHGMMLLPFAIGIAIRRRVDWRLVVAAPALALATLLLVQPPAPLPAIGLWALAGLLPDRGAGLFALLAALAIGTFAWFTALLTTRTLAADSISPAAGIAALGFCLFAPVGLPALVVPVALTLYVKDGRVACTTILAAILAMALLPALATAMLVAGLGLVAQPFLRPAANDNPFLLKTRAMPG